MVAAEDGLAGVAGLVAEGEEASEDLVVEEGSVGEGEGQAGRTELQRNGLELQKNGCELSEEHGCQRFSSLRRDVIGGVMARPRA